jgi:CBS domain-containing protein
MATLVRDSMSTAVLTIRPDQTLRDAARLMSARRVGAAVVMDPATHGIGILTERDILDAVAWGQDPDTERAEDHLTSDLVYATGDWTLDQAARAMARGGFRHLVVLEDDEVVGMISVRDIVDSWATQPAAVPPQRPMVVG